MKAADRATQVWHFLIVAATRREKVTYGQVADETGASAQSLGMQLRPIERYCSARGLPWLTSIVVSSKTGTPGSGFGAHDETEEELAKVFAHDWLRTRTPEPEDLFHYLDSAVKTPATD